MDEKVEETKAQRLIRVRAEAKELGIVGLHTADKFEELIVEAKVNGVAVQRAPGLTADEAEKIDARLKYEEEAREKFRVTRQIDIDRASIIAESESAGIVIDLPDKPTELDLARARTKLGIEKVEVKPSPETLEIEASKRGYYVFTNLRQDDAAHTINTGGKYYIDLIPDQIHVLSAFHIKFCRQKSVVPTYERVSTGAVPGPDTVGQLAEECKRTGGKPRFSFEYLGEAPQDAPFGIVTNAEILSELNQEQLV